MRHAFLPLLALAANAAAQSLSVAVPAPTTLSAQAGASSQTQTLPAGPASAFGSLQAYAGTATAVTVVSEVFWYSYTSPYFCYFRTYAAAAVLDGPGQASVGTNTFLVSLTNATPAYVAIELDRFSWGPAGSVVPIARIDVDDDGTFELTEQTVQQPVVVYRMLGPTPLVVRCVVDAAVSAPLGAVADVFSEVSFRVTRGDTLVSQTLPGCIGSNYGVAARLDGNLDYWIDNVFAGSSVAVFGLGVQPLFLGVNTPGYGSTPMPCVLMPQPDLLVFLPTAATNQLVIPPAARPIALYTQAVTILPTGFATSGALQVFAY